MGIEENKKVVRSFFEAGNRGDMEACFGLLADDIVWTNIGSTRFSGTCTGKQELAEKIVGPLMGSLKAGIASTLEDLVAEGDRVVALSSGRAETTDGRAYNNRYCHVMRLRDGRIARVTEYLDTDLVRSVFGAAPPSS